MGGPLTSVSGAETSARRIFINAISGCREGQISVFRDQSVRGHVGKCDAKPVDCRFGVYVGEVQVVGGSVVLFAKTQLPVRTAAASVFVAGTRVAAILN